MSHLRSSSLASLAAVLLIGGSACEQDDARIGSKDSTVASPTNNGLYSAGATAAAPDAGVSVTSLADPQIMSVLSTMNAGVVERGTIASDKAHNDTVRALARNLTASHLAAQERLTALVTSARLSAALNVADADNPVSQQLLMESQRITTQLRAENDRGFDSAYLQAELDRHVRMLQLFDTLLLPSADNPLLQVELERARTDTMVDLQRVRGAVSALDVDSDAGAPDSDAGN